MLYLIPLERYASIPFCGPYFLVGRNLRTKYDPLYETDQSTNSKIPVKAWMTRESISTTRMTSSSVLFSIAMKHFLPRLGKNALTRSPFIGDKTGFYHKTDTGSASVCPHARFQIFDHIWRRFFIENGRYFENWWQLVQFRYFKRRSTASS